MTLVPFETILTDGTRVAIREVTPADRDLLRVGFEHLSAASRYFRFLGAVHRLSDRQLAFFTRQNTPDHVAVGAMVLNDAGTDPVAIARYVRLPDRPDAAEFAITVIDETQGKGLGSLLLGVLAKCARRHGIAEFVGLVHRRNAVMLHVLDGLGGQRTDAGQSEVRVRFALHADPRDYPDTGAGVAMRTAHALAEFD